MHQERNSNRLWLKKTADAEHRPMLDDEGNPVNDCDISEHKKPRGQIAIDENLLRITFDAIQDGVSVLNKNLEILKVNKTLEQWYSHKMPFIGKKCYQVYQNYQEPCRLCPSIRAMEEKTMQVEIKPFTGEKGKIGWLELFSYPLMDDQGSIAGVVEFVRDITERKQAQEEELNVYEQIVSSSNDLMALIDREYRYRIVNKAYTTRFNLNKGQIIGRHISEIIGAGGFHNTIKPMLDRCFAGETVNYAAWFDIPDSGRRYLDVTYSPCYINETAIKGAAVVVRDITQVLNNIVINARQAMPDGGKITLTAENVIVNTDNQDSYLTDGSYVKFSIQDEGIGIPKEHLPKIFDPFFTTKQKGSGLGLATSYSIIKNHGGHISVEFERGVADPGYG